MAHSLNDAESLTVPGEVMRFCEQIGYPLESTKTQRIIGPIVGKPTPPQGSEIYVAKIPKYLLEDFLFPYFRQSGDIYKFRLMLTNSKITRGIAFITYYSVEVANKSVDLFNGREIHSGCKIVVEKSKDNRRLFIGGIPDHKTKDEIWHELEKLGMPGIIDVIMYRSYSDKNRNRGFVFVEFNSHQEAAKARFAFKNTLVFKQRVAIDWASPVYNVNDDVMAKVKILFLRNLNVCQDREEFVELVRGVLDGLHTVDKIYKFRDYAFIHFKTRRDAQKAMWELKTYYKKYLLDVEIEWAKPPPKDKKSKSSNENSGTPTTPNTRCNCICKHTYVPNLEQVEVDNSENLFPDFRSTNFELNNCFSSTPTNNRTPFLNLNNDEYSSLMLSPQYTLPTPPSSSTFSLDINTPSSFLDERSPPLQSLWNLGVDLAERSLYK